MTSSAALGLTARELSWTDIPVLVDLDRELFGPDGWSAASWWHELAARPRRDYVVVEDEVGVAAYGGIDVAGETADLMTIATHTRVRGRGVGRRLLAELESRALARGAQAMLLEVRADNTAARALYDATGYGLLDVRRRYYQPGDVDAHVLRKHLGGDR